MEGWRDDCVNRRSGCVILEEEEDIKALGIVLFVMVVEEEDDLGGVTLGVALALGLRFRFEDKDENEDEVNGVCVDDK